MPGLMRYASPDPLIGEYSDDLRKRADKTFKHRRSTNRVDCPPGCVPQENKLGRGTIKKKKDLRKQRNLEEKEVEKL